MEAVLDASALLAYLQNEPGAKAVEAILENAVISTVNWAEVIQKTLDAGVDITGMRDDLESLGLAIHNFTPDQAETAAMLRKQTKKFGLSLGDRACLSLGMALSLPVMTSDKTWSKPSLPVKVKIIR